MDLDENVGVVRESSNARGYMGINESVGLTHLGYLVI
jgi:hypothetical protein